MNKLAPAIVIALLAIVFVSCSPTPPSETLRQRLTEPETDGEGSPISPASAPEKFSMVDAEMAFELKAVLADDARADNLTVDELINMKKELDLVTIDVTAPHPKELWLSFRVETKKNLDKTPLGFRADVYRDKTVVAEFRAAVGGRSQTEPFEYRFNALEGWDALPETTIIHAQGDLVLLPQDTDLGAVDVSAAVAAAPEKGVVLSNPVRINFKGAEDAP